MAYWLIIGREKGRRKFFSFDGQSLSSDAFRALTWPPDQGERVKQIVEHLNEDNPRYEFKVMIGVSEPDGRNSRPSGNRWARRTERC